MSIPIPKGRSLQPRDVHELKAAFLKAQNHYDEESKPLLSIIGMIRSIEKDLRSRDIVTAFTKEVHECHARLSLEDGNVRDFALTMVELEKMYESEGSPDELEMVAYSIMYFVLYGSRDDVQKRLERGSFVSKSDACFEYARAFARSWLDGKPIVDLLEEAKLTEPPGHMSHALKWFTDKEIQGIVAQTKKKEENRLLAKTREAAKRSWLSTLAPGSDRQPFYKKSKGENDYTQNEYSDHKSLIRKNSRNSPEYSHHKSLTKKSSRSSPGYSDYKTLGHPSARSKMNNGRNEKWQNANISGNGRNKEWQSVNISGTKYTTKYVNEVRLDREKSMNYQRREETGYIPDSSLKRTYSVSHDSYKPYDEINKVYPVASGSGYGNYDSYTDKPGTQSRAQSYYRRDETPLKDDYYGEEKLRLGSNKISEEQLWARR